MATLIALVTQWWPALLAAVAGVFGLTAWRQRKVQGRLERDAEIERKDALLQRQMAKVEKPTEDEARRRLRDGTA